MSTFSSNFSSALKAQTPKRKFSDNHGHNILDLYNILVQIRFTTSKMKFDIQVSKLGIRVAPRVIKRLKTWDLKKLGNIRKILDKFQFYSITSFCSKYFVTDSLSKQIFGLNSTQSRSNSNLFIFFITPNHFDELQQEYKTSHFS